MGIIKEMVRQAEDQSLLRGPVIIFNMPECPTLLSIILGDNDNDYTDDYRSRGEYVNYLKGAPFGPNVKRESEGLRIPVDLSMSFHTDAGISIMIQR